MAHCSTILSQMLKIVPRHVFSTLDKAHGTGRTARRFSRWDQFVHLMSIQLTGRSSLRDGVRSMRSRSNNLYHLGTQPVVRSTFAEANEKRPASFFEALFGRVCSRCRPIAPKHKFKFKNKLFSLDATTISLCLSLFPWARFRKTKAGIKINTLLDHDGYLPAFVSISEAKRHESKTARAIYLPKGSIVAMDKAYIAFAWLFSLANRGQMGRLPSGLAKSRLPRQGDREALRLFDQQLRSLGQDHRRYLQGALADRDLLPLHQAEPENQILYRQLPQCRSFSGLCGLDCLPFALLPQVPLSPRIKPSATGSTPSTQPLQTLHHPEITSTARL